MGHEGQRGQELKELKEEQAFEVAVGRDGVGQGHVA